MAYVITIVDFTIVNVALPTIGRKLHFPESDLQGVVTAYGLTFGGFLLLGAGGQHEHGNAALFAQAPQDLETVEAGEHDVENHEIESAVEGPLQAAAAFMHGFDREALAGEKLRQQGAELGVVVD